MFIQLVLSYIWPGPPISKNRTAKIQEKVR
jgi:hypothetical protein